MTTPEGKVKAWLNNKLDKKYGHLTKWVYAPPGGRFGTAGTMDKIMLIPSHHAEDAHLIAQYGPPPGVFAGIEVKSGESSYDVTPLQKARLLSVYKAGGVAASLIGKDEVKLNQIFAEIDRRRELCRSAWLNMIGQLTKDGSPSSTSATP